MTAKKCVLTLMMGLVLSGMSIFTHGCKESPDTSVQAASTSVALCVKCGQIKGTELCCKADQATCSKCGLVEGSPGCCNIPKDAQTSAICTTCGQIKGSEMCCKANQPTCTKCGLVKGSPGCCKISKQ